MPDPFIGQIMMFAGNFAPQGWAKCDGQLLAISQNQALFSILGTTYGGDGVSTFGLPDLRGRAPINWGQGPGLSNRTIGQELGQETVQLTTPELPAHNHVINARPSEGDALSPAGNVVAKSGQGDPDYYSGTDGLVPMASGAVGPTGDGQAHANMPPVLAVTFIIALEGVFPSRS